MYQVMREVEINRRTEKVARYPMASEFYTCILAEDVCWFFRLTFPLILRGLGETDYCLVIDLSRCNMQ